jgi:hypothetical protein
MLATNKSRPSVSGKGDTIPSLARPTVAMDGQVPLNPLWDQLATQVQSKLPIGVQQTSGSARIQRQEYREGQAGEDSLVPEDDQLACLLFMPWPWKSLCFRTGSSGSSPSPAFSPAPAPGVMPPSGPPPTSAFFHGSTWRIAQSIPGKVQPIGGGDFGQGFYTHHDKSVDVASDRARLEGCRLCQKMSPTERYAGVIRFDVPDKDYKSLFGSRKTFGLTSTTQSNYAAQQKKWLDFVSGPGHGRETDPTFDTAHMSWRHQRVDPPPDQGFSLIEGPMYKGVAGLPGASVPPRSAFDPYAEGTELPQQVVWNHQAAMDVLNKAPTTLKQFDATSGCVPVDPPASVPPLTASVAEDPKALEAAQIEMTVT